MRRVAVVVTLALAGLLIAAPAQAFAHTRVQNPALHAVLDGLTLLIVSAPVWTALLWGGGNRRHLAALVAMVQIPVAVIGFTTIVDPLMHLALFVIALAITGAALRAVRLETRATAPATAD